MFRSDIAPVIRAQKSDAAHVPSPGCAAEDWAVLTKESVRTALPFAICTKVNWTVAISVLW